MKLDLDEMLGAWVELGESVRRGRTSGPATEAPLTPVERAGETLFESLFTGKVKELWAYSLGQQYEKTLTEMTGLRVKLEMDPDVPEMAQLMSLPWEFLYRADERRFLCLDPSTPLVRYLNVPQPIAPYKFAPPLRILMVISRATSDANKYAPLDLATERKRIEEAWTNVPNVEVDFLPRATLTALRPKLLQRDYHVLHFMGHGDFDLNEGKGVLLFEDDSGDAHPINGRDLADQLIGKQSLRLVFLNACESARMSDAPGHDPFAGTAAALVMSGIPAVIAMQYPISDRAAITFASAFYTNLAGGCRWIRPPPKGDWPCAASFGIKWNGARRFFSCERTTANCSTWRRPPCPRRWIFPTRWSPPSASVSASRNRPLLPLFPFLNKPNRFCGSSARSTAC
ncbi:MAG: CHAT domain-containing protein [Chloroflexi bacterium]|nr:CHAT domain-containing protein [Chloroflexota bacterium]